MPKWITSPDPGPSLAKRYFPWRDVPETHISRTPSLRRGSSGSIVGRSPDIPERQRPVMIGVIFLRMVSTSGSSGTGNYQVTEIIKICP
jgi:hypothetical protein